MCAHKSTIFVTHTHADGTASSPVWTMPDPSSSSHSSVIAVRSTATILTTRTTRVGSPPAILPTYSWSRHTTVGLTRTARNADRACLLLSPSLAATAPRAPAPQTPTKPRCYLKLTRRDTVQPACYQHRPATLTRAPLGLSTCVGPHNPSKIFARHPFVNQLDETVGVSDRCRAPRRATTHCGRGCPRV
jgi:hypothetical protein